MANKNKLIIKVACSPWINESRDMRELSVYRDLGYDVAVLAKGDNSDTGRADTVSGYKVYRYTARPLGERLPNIINKALSIFLWAGFVRQLSPHAVSGHDILGLTVGWLSGWFMSGQRKPKLIYDSHEFELGRNASRSKLHTKMIGFWEKFLMKRCTFSIMVNDSIADEVQRIHKLPERPVVVRSTPDYWDIDKSVCAEKRRFFLSKFGHSPCESTPFLLMYHGILTDQRGIEMLIRVTARNPNVCSVIMGNGSESYFANISKLIAELGVGDRVLLHQAVPLPELWKYVGAVDLSVMMIEATSKSYYYALPNKFFESIQSLTPILSSDFPEMKRIIDQYKIGLSCPPNDLEVVNSCIELIRTNHALYAELKNNLITAKSELCWANEKLVLVDAAKSLC